MFNEEFEKDLELFVLPNNIEDNIDVILKKYNIDIN